MRSMVSFSDMMETPINIRFKDSLKELEQLLEDIRDENKPSLKQLEQYEIFPRESMEDNIYSVINKEQLSLRIVLMNVPTLASNVSKIFETLLIPYRVKIDAGAMLLTQSFDLYPYHASKNSSLKLDNDIIRDADDIQRLMSQLGWPYDGYSEKLHNNAHFIEMCIDNQEERFGLSSNSHFNFAELCYVEMYISCDQPLVKQWHEGIGDIKD